MPDRDHGAAVGGVSAAVARRDRLTVIISGGEAGFGPGSDAPAAAMAAVDALAAENQWGFEQVAAALHQLVVDHRPPGVAALLATDDDPMVFLFDNGRADEFDADAPTTGTGHTVHEGEGRLGWTTKIVTGPVIRLSLDGGETATGWGVLHRGLAVGEVVVERLAGDTAPGAAAAPKRAAEPEDPPNEPAPLADPVPAGAAEPVESAAPGDEDASIGATIAVDRSQIGASRLDDAGGSGDPAPPPGAPPPSGTPLGMPPDAPGPGGPPPGGPPPGPGGPPPGPAGPGGPPPSGAPLPGPGAPPPPGSGTPPPGPPPGLDDAPTPPPGLGTPPPGPPPGAGAPPPAVQGFAAPPPGPPGNAPGPGHAPPPGFGAPPPGAGPGALPPPGAPPGAPPPGSAPPPGPGAPPGSAPPPGPGAPPGAAPPPGPPPGGPGAPPPGGAPTAQPVGYLVDEGNAVQIPITATTVIGSQPEQDPDVIAGSAATVAIDDPGLSHVHARIRIAGQGTTVEAVGTAPVSVQAAGGAGLVAISPTPHPLQPGDTVFFGSRRFVFHPPGGLR